MTGSALGLAANQTFGTHPGRVPAFLHEAYLIAEGGQRTRLAIALTRAWVYGGDPARAVPFAAEAVAHAGKSGDNTLLAEALDAQLLVNWGPDDFDERLRITTQLEDVVAHVPDVEARMSAYLWRMTTALESLDPVTLRRQLRALGVLAAESPTPRVRFFALSRQAMHALLMGETARADELRHSAVAAGTEAGEADAFAIDHSLAGAIAQQSGDLAALTAEAEVYEAFGRSEGLTSVAAQGAELWTEAGRPERARPIVDEIAGNGLAAVARDVDWMLTVCTLSTVASQLGVSELTAECVDALTPYAGRGVVDAGAVGFPGVVDDYLGQAHLALGQTAEAADRFAQARLAYQRLGARHLLQKLDSRGGAATPPTPSSKPGGANAATTPTVVYLRPGADGIWTVGASDAPAPLREMKGFYYLRALLREPDVEITAIALSDWTAGHAGASLADGSADELIDRRALTAYRARLAEIDEELDEAHEWADDGRLARIRAEREALLDEIRSATGLGGRRRRTSSTGERARVAVRKAVAAAIERIADHDPPTGRLLRDCIETGTVCRYCLDPARPIDWLLD